MKGSRRLLRSIVLTVALFYLLMFVFVYLRLHSSSHIQAVTQLLSQGAALEHSHSSSSSLLPVKVNADVITNPVLDPFVHESEQKSLTHNKSSSAAAAAAAALQLSTNKTASAAVAAGSDKHTLPSSGEITSWKKLRSSACDGKIRMYRNEIITFADLTVAPELCIGAMKLVNHTEVLQQPEAKEFFNYKLGFFSMTCTHAEQMRQVLGARYNTLPQHFKRWSESFVFTKATAADNKNDDVRRDDDVTVRDSFMLAMVRYEYANVYWNIIDLYDAYMTCVVNNRTLGETTIFIVDAHPRGHLDHLWSNSFRDIIRPADLQGRTLFKHFSWLFPRDNSPMLRKDKRQPPGWLAFRQEILAHSSITSEPRRCPGGNAAASSKQTVLRVLLIWRHDYVAHPRNPNGLIMRKIKNEAQLERHLKGVYPTFLIRGVQLDALGIEEQLYLLANSDILVGMHGAAMAFSVFMPPGSAVIELYPSYYPGSNWHMEYIALWSGHHYVEWHNKNARLDDKKRGYSTIPTEQLQLLVDKAVKKLCPR